MLDRLGKSWSGRAVVGATIACALLAGVAFLPGRSGKGGHPLSPSAYASNLEPAVHAAQQTLVRQQVSFTPGKDHESIVFWAQLLSTGADHGVTLCVLLPGDDDDTATEAYVSDNYDTIMQTLTAAASQAHSAPAEAAAPEADGQVLLISKTPKDPADRAIVQRMFQARGLAADMQSSAS